MKNLASGKTFARVLIAVLIFGTTFHYGLVLESAGATNNPPPLCGNNVIDPLEQCDDGNTVGTDGCSAQCKLEPACGNNVIEAPEQCDDGGTAGGDGCSATCTLEPVCGNNVIESPEQCDDGATVNGDGCSATCTLEPVCGNNVIEAGEQCDDGGIISGDGCSVSCVLEPSCGNNVIESPEQCDDGATVGGDGCSATCTLEPVCGNNVIESPEQCDDGGTVAGDGCSATCTTELVCISGGAFGLVNGANATLIVPTNGCPVEASFSSYSHQGTIVPFDQQVLVDNITDTYGPGTHQIGPVQLSCNWQTDLYLGPVLVHVSPAGHDADRVLLAYDYIENQICAPVCGNNILETGEQCDDGDVVSGDGCSAACVLEPICGNAIVEAGEQCDDGNTTNGDGCNNSCQTEGGGTGGTGTTGGGSGGTGTTGGGSTGGGSGTTGGSGGGGSSGGGSGGSGGVPPPPPSLFPDLAMAKIVNRGFTNPGATVTYTVTITNNGKAPAINVQLTDVLPTGFTFTDNGAPSNTWLLGNLGVGESKTVSYIVDVADTVLAGTYKNAALAQADNQAPIRAEALVDVVVPEILGEDFEELPRTGGETQFQLVVLTDAYLGWFKAFRSAQPTVKISPFFGIGPASATIVLDTKNFLIQAEAMGDVAGQTNDFKTATRLLIPKINVDIAIVEGKDADTALRAGAWRLPVHASSDQTNNTVLAAHRWLYRPPRTDTFYNLDKLQVGDEFFVVWEDKKVRYRITESKIVRPDQVEVIKPTEQPRVTLITCAPLYAETERLVVVGQPS